MPLRSSRTIRRIAASLSVTVFCLAILLAAPGFAQDPQETALDRYVFPEDPAFHWEYQKSYPGLGYGLFQLRLTSQKWRVREEVEPNFWEHWLMVIVPLQVRSTTALLVIDGGRRDDAEPDPADFAALGVSAAATGIVVATLTAVPNQPLRFAGEARERSEDAIIAYTWDKFLRGGDEEWPAQLPMTKAAVWAMTAVSQFLASPQGGGHAINDFILAGASKRGWTAWLAAATDPRVVGIVPIVFDALNLETAFRHHWQTYGFWSPAVHDYEEMGIFAWLGSRQSRSLMQIVDPFQYRDRLTMPKYIINASGDEFFPPTSSQFYFNDLPGQNYLRYVPNAGHGMEGDDLEADIMLRTLAWVGAIVTGQPLPHFTWEFPAPNRIVVTTADQPSAVRLWQAANPSARDFRFTAIGPAWTSTPLEPTDTNVYEAEVQVPASGWRAFFVELEFPSPFPSTYVFTTPVRVVPEALPYPPPLATTLAASYEPYTAPDAIASTFSEDLSAAAEVATSLPLPTELGGAGVRVIDASGAVHQAGLFFVSPRQINFLVPPGAATGIAEIQVWRNGRRVTGGQMLIETLAPGIFSANGDGQGVAAAIAVYVKPDGSQEFRIVFDTSQPEGSREPVPIRIPSNEQVYLSLYGTGMRNAGEITATIGGEPVDVTGPAPSPEFAGVDQINLGPLPVSLRRRGEVPIVVIADGVQANIVTVEIL